MSLQSQLDEYKKGFLTKVPADALAVMQRATADLANSGLVAKAVEPGQPAPDFTLPNTEEQETGLSGLLQKGHLVLTFYRGKW